MQNQGYKKTLAWILTAALLNMLLVATNGGMASANQDKCMHSSAMEHPCTIDMSTCHAGVSAGHSLELAGSCGCAADHCDSTCSTCIHMSSALPAGLISISSSAIESFIPGTPLRLVESGDGLVPPPPK